MKTIEDLRIETVAYRKVNGPDGKLVSVEYTKMVARAPETVSQGIRIGYYLIDVVIFYIIQFIFGIALALGFGIFEIPVVLSYLISISCIFGYYFIMEGFTGGSIGKLITGYIVIDEFAERPTLGKIAVRTLARLIPFEAFSCLSERGWHDTMSKTYVVKLSEKDKLKKLLDGFSDNTDLLD